jgi:pSer/pThr/pTyr-binding forkhead associated (FHA) protein
MNDSQPHGDAAEPATVPLRLMLQPSGPALELTRSGMVLGRHTEADVRLPLPDVSRRHCRFDYVDNAWHVQDLDSLNGVYVNGQRVPRATLNEADTVGIGGFVFAVQFVRVSTSASGPEDSHAVESLPMPTQRLTMPHRKAS